MRKFDFSNSIEEIEIAGKVYSVSLKDVDRKKYTQQLQKFYVLVTKAENSDHNQISIEESLQQEEEVKNFTLEILDMFFGEGAGQELYKAADEQTEELLSLIYEVAEMFNGRREAKFSKYTKKAR